MINRFKSLPAITSLAHAVGTPLVVGLAYHGSTVEKLGGLDNVWGKHIDAATFEAHVRFITQHYRVVAVSEIVACLRERKPLPRKCCFITFDDGYVGNYEVAYPILKKYGAVASFYIATAFIESGRRYPLDVLDAAIKYSDSGHPRTSASAEKFGSPPLAGGQGGVNEALQVREKFKALPETEQQSFLEAFAQQHGFRGISDVPELGPHARFMDWNQMCEMQASGMEFGSHTHRHYILARVSEQAAIEELQTSKAILEKNLGMCEQFCYPNGHYPADGSERTNELVRQAGYSCALYMSGGAVTNAAHPYQLTRHGVGLTTTVQELAAILGGVGARVRSLVR